MSLHEHLVPVSWLNFVPQSAKDAAQDKLLPWHRQKGIGAMWSKTKIIKWIKILGPYIDQMPYSILFSCFQWACPLSWLYNLYIYMGYFLLKKSMAYENKISQGSLDATIDQATGITRKVKRVQYIW